MGNAKVTYKQQTQFGTMFAINIQSTSIKEGKFEFNDTMTSLSEKLSSSVTESASENQNHNSSFSDNKTLPDSPIKRKCKRRLYNSYVQRSSPRSNHLITMTENLTLLKMFEIMRQMIQKKVLKKLKKKNKIFTLDKILKQGYNALPF